MLKPVTVESPHETFLLPHRIGLVDLRVFPAQARRLADSGGHDLQMIVLVKARRVTSLRRFLASNDVPNAMVDP